MNVSTQRRLRNGKIELLRFIFATTVLFFHARLAAWDHDVTLYKGLLLFPMGKLGVEFFFILSGFFMAKSIESDLNQHKFIDSNSDSLSDDTFNYVKRRVRAVLPYHVPFCLAALAIGVYNHFGNNLPKYLINSILTLFFLNSTGLVMGSKGLIAPEWYLSSMFLTLLLLYPLVKKYWSTVPLTVCPLIGFLCIGYIVHTNEGFPGNIEDWGGITLYSNLRALGEMSLGVTSYALSAKLTNHTFSNTLYTKLLKIVEFLSYLIALLLMCTTLPHIPQLVLLLLFTGLTISMSIYGFGNNSTLFQNSFTRYLGAISLPVYISQDVVRTLVRVTDPPISGTYRFLLIVIITYVVSVVSVFLHRWTCVQIQHFSKKHVEDYTDYDV